MFARLAVFSAKPLFTLDMLRDLHDGTWFRLDGGYLIDTSLGSRQGCKFGA